ncbi:MAG: helix-turn-helix transcriptional regulator [Fibrobacterota bacterium]|nr:helix-turn-helix transcriptional regulator [Fibrobacterota bacterium]QQS06598.1 MAG: helix-turn-helix transcriptional regulator [Fibrobacterota bacterium]
MTRKLSGLELEARRATLRQNLRDGTLSLGESVREMRKLTGLTQKDYAERVAKVFPRVLMDIERGKANPTLETLERIAKPWGWKIGFIPPPEGSP